MESLNLVLKKCPSCQEPKPFNEVLFLQCGHSTCTECVLRFDEKPRRCSLCRALIEVSPHRIYLDFSEITQERINPIAEGLKKINANTPAASVVRGASKIRKQLESSDEKDPAMEMALLIALNNLEDRTAPLFTQLEEAKAENGRLRETLISTQSSREVDKAKLRIAKFELQKELEERKRQSDRAEKYRTLLRQKESEMVQLRSEHAEQEKQMNLMKIKLKALAKVHRRKPRRSVNDSMVVEG